MGYDHKTIEPKWQGFWDEKQVFFTDVYDFSKPKYYILDMFPYPSAQGLHVGHPEGYTATDIIARMKRMQGFNVLHPMGWDAFGLPAEQYAIKTNHHPAGFTDTNIANIKRQIKALGFSYDWTKELATTDPKYFKWTQWNEAVKDVKAEYGVWHHYESNSNPNTWQPTIDSYLSAISAQGRKPICTEYNWWFGDQGTELSRVAASDGTMNRYNSWLKSYAIRQKVELMLKHRINGDPAMRDGGGVPYDFYRVD